MPAVVTIDGKVIGRLAQEFDSLQAACTFVVAECVRRRRALDVTLELPAVPDWGLPTGGLYRFAVTAPDESGECGWSLDLVSEG